MRSIKRQFSLALFVAGCAVFIVLTGYNLFVMRQDINRSVDEKLSLQVKNEAQRLAKALDDIGAGTEYFASSLASMEEIDHPQALAYLKTHLERYPIIYGGGYWFEPYFFGPETKYYGPFMYKKDDKAHLTWIYSGPEYDYFRHQWYKNGTTTNLDIVWTEPFIDEVSQVDMITGTSAIRRAGKFIGVTTVDVSLKKLQDYVQQIRVGENGFAFIVADNNRILTDNPPFRALISDAENRKKLIYSVLQGEGGNTIKKVRLNQQKVYLNYAKIGSTNMYFGIVMPEAEAMGAFYRAVEYNTIGFAVVMAIFFLVFGVLFNRRVARPLTELVEASARLSTGDLDVRIVSERRDEFGVLSDSFNEMAGKLSQQINLLRYRLEFEKIISSVSSNYIDIQMEYLGNSISGTLGILGRFMGADRAFIVMLDSQHRKVEEVFEWHDSDLAAAREFLFEHPFSQDVALYRQLMAEGVLKVLSINQTAADSQENIPTSLSEYLRTFVGVSFMLSSGRLGVLGLSSMEERQQWANEDIAMLKILSEIFSNALQRQDAEEKILKLARFDRLTGLRNRMYFEQEMERFRIEQVQNPALLIFDIDGLKLVNDTYGHNRGDELLLFLARCLDQGGASEEITARVGGDEFVILMPDATEEKAQRRCQLIKEQVEKHNKANLEIFFSLSTGYAIAEAMPENYADFFREADNAMYREKLHHAKSNRSAIVQTLMKALEARDFITEGHALRLEDLMEKMARSINMSEKEIADMRLLAQFHDIGKVGIPDSILMKPGPLTADEYRQMQRHSEIGYHIAQSSPDLAPIADYILMHHERWDGTGAPLQLSGVKIPLPCRMLAIADAYDAMISDRPYRRAMSEAAAIAELKRCSGTQFDPDLIENFMKIIK
jgi:diguanylate cyclase (GGDEF)-like protein